MLGLGLTAIGVVLWLMGKSPFTWRMPGDIIIDRPGLKIFFPLGTSILLSVLLSLLLWFLRK